jgi:hypothetical protein
LKDSLSPLGLLFVDDLGLTHLKLFDGAGQLTSTFRQSLEKIRLSQALINNFSLKITFCVAFGRGLVAIRAFT